jgi:signal transduction histidine kinase
MEGSQHYMPEPRPTQQKALLFVGALLVLCALYVGTGRLGLSLGAVSGFATLVWFPSGLSVTALLLFGFRLWPAIFLGALVVNLLKGAPLPVALGIGIGNMLEALVCAALLKRWRVHSSLDELRDVLLLALLAAPASTLLSATVGVSSLLLGGVVTWPATLAAWSAWWAGDLVSILILVPLLLTWRSWPRVTYSRTHLAELGLLVLCVIATGSVVFLGLLHPEQPSYPLTYLVSPPLVWAALRFGPRGASAASAAFASLAVIGIIRGVSPFSSGSLSERLFLLQGFMGITAATTLILAAVMAERHALEQRKDAFIGLASHELRTPLTVLQTYTELLRRQMEELGHQQALLWLARMRRQIEQLSRLTTDFLDLSRIQVGQLTFSEEAVDVGALAGEVVESLQQGSTQHQISVEGSASGTVIGDRERLRQVVSNLLSNAIKYSPHAERIVVRLTSAPGMLTVSVQDFGMGIPKAQQERIFERYYRVSSKQVRTAPGLGLGLYLAQHIVQHHGGKLWVESVEGQGSTFSFSLPAQASGTMSPVEAQADLDVEAVEDA